MVNSRVQPSLLGFRTGWKGKNGGPFFEWTFNGQLAAISLIKISCNTREIALKWRQRQHKMAHLLQMPSGMFTMRGSVSWFLWWQVDFSRIKTMVNTFHRCRGAVDSWWAFLVLFVTICCCSSKRVFAANRLLRSGVYLVTPSAECMCKLISGDWLFRFVDRTPNAYSLLFPAVGANRNGSFIGSNWIFDFNCALVIL